MFYDANNNQLSASAFGVRHLFTGQQWYQELGLYDLRNRFYSPDLGRFLQPDPIGFWGGRNLYRYCRNNPVMRWDPLGLDDDDMPPKLPEKGGAPLGGPSGGGGDGVGGFGNGFDPGFVAGSGEDGALLNTCGNVGGVILGYDATGSDGPGGNGTVGGIGGIGGPGGFEGLGGLGTIGGVGGPGGFGGIGGIGSPGAFPAGNEPGDRDLGSRGRGHAARGGSRRLLSETIAAMSQYRLEVDPSKIVTPVTRQFASYNLVPFAKALDAYALNAARLMAIPVALPAAQYTASYLAFAFVSGNAQEIANFTQGLGGIPSDSYAPTTFGGLLGFGWRTASGLLYDPGNYSPGE